VQPESHSYMPTSCRLVVSLQGSQTEMRRPAPCPTTELQSGVQTRVQTASSETYIIPGTIQNLCQVASAEYPCSSVSLSLSLSALVLYRNYCDLIANSSLAPVAASATSLRKLIDTCLVLHPRRPLYPHPAHLTRVWVRTDT
jgi:hypothetical protein